MDTTLWVNETDDRYFLIPDAIIVQPGDVALHSPLNDRRIVASEAALARFEISADEARAHFLQDIEPLVDETVQLVVDRWDTDIRPHFEAIPDLMRQVLGSLLGVDMGEIEKNPSLDSEHIAALLKEIAAAMKSGSSQNKQMQSLARAQLRDIRKRLRAQGIDVDKRFEQMIADAFPKEKVAAIVEQFTAQLQQAGQGADPELERVLDELERDFGSFFAKSEEEERREEQARLREYRKSADDAIAAALRAHGLDSFVSLSPAPTKRGRRG